MVVISEHRQHWMHHKHKITQSSKGKKDNSHGEPPHSVNKTNSILTGTIFDRGDFCLSHLPFTGVVWLKITHSTTPLPPSVTQRFFFNNMLNLIEAD